MNPHLGPNQVNWQQVQQLLTAEFTEPVVWKLAIAFGMFALMVLLLGAIFWIYVVPVGDFFADKVRALWQSKFPGKDFRHD